MSSPRMSVPERGMIYVESGGELRGVSDGNYVIKIQIGEEKLHPVRIDVSGRAEEESSSGQSSPRSDLTPPLPARLLAKSGLRFGSETSESDTESDVSSADFRGCPAAQFALREGRSCPTSPDASPRQSPLSCEEKGKGRQADNGLRHRSLARWPDMLGEHRPVSNAAWTKAEARRARTLLPNTAAHLPRTKQVLVDETGFHLNEIPPSPPSLVPADQNDPNFAGYKDILSRDSPKPIMSEKGTIRGVKNRVRDGIATFLQSNDIKSYSEKEQGRVVVYVTSMGVVRDTFQRCQKVKQILRTLLVKFDERDCYMNRSIQNEIRARLSTFLPNVNTETNVHLPQVFLEGQHLGDTDTIEKMNETGELRDLLRPYKSLSVLSTCERCGGFRMLPCQICNGSKKSIHRNHFTAEFVALKCMHCDPSGLVRCDLCNPMQS